MATIADITKRIHANTAKKDKAVAAFRVEQSTLTADLDVLKSAEAAVNIVAGMSSDERQAVLSELGGN